MLDDLLEGDTDADTWWFDGRRIGERRSCGLRARWCRRSCAMSTTLGDGALDYRDANPAFRALDAMSIAQWLDRTRCRAGCAS